MSEPDAADGQFGAEDDRLLADLLDSPGSDGPAADLLGDAGANEDPDADRALPPIREPEAEAEAPAEAQAEAVAAAPRAWRLGLPGKGRPFEGFEASARSIARTRPRDARSTCSSALDLMRSEVLPSGR